MTPESEYATQRAEPTAQGRVSVLIVAYNGRDDLPLCLTSMESQTYSNYEIIVVDSGSTDGTASFVRREYPHVKLLASTENLGYRRGNRLGFKLATGEYILVLNADTEVAPDCLAHLVGAVEEDSTVGLATPKILMFDDRQVVNEVGNTLHYSGMCGSRGIGEPASNYVQAEDLSAVSGACFLIRHDLLERLGGFSEIFDLFDTGYHSCGEEYDLAWRAQMAGYRIRLAPQALVYHKYLSKPMTGPKFCTFEFGRWMVVLLNYELRTLLLLLPLLILLDMMLWVYALVSGRAWVSAKWNVASWITRNVRLLRTIRRRVQSQRIVRDGAILKRLSPTIDVLHVVSHRPWARWGQAVIDWAFSANYKLLLRIVE
jgi:GT2 family glycosyltransferase